MDTGLLLNSIAPFLSIVLIDLVLAGDNAVVIAMAVRCLPRKQRSGALYFGAAGAVALRVLLTFFAAKFLQFSGIKLLGGVLILWIALKLFSQKTPAPDSDCTEAKTLRHAIGIIVMADLTMSLDNVLALAGASKGNPILLLFGLGLTIPFIVFTSSLLTHVMDRYPVIVYLGAAILGKVGAEMIFTDPMVAQSFQPSTALFSAMEAFFAVAVVAGGKFLVFRNYRQKAPRSMSLVPSKEDRI
jgi:YjbE family integral membrane protein